MSNSFKLCPTHFYRGVKNILGGLFPHAYGPGKDMDVRKGENDHSLSLLEIGTRNQNFLAHIDLILALTVYLPAWHPQCIRTRFTVLLLCSDELAVHSCPLPCLSAGASCETCVQNADCSIVWLYCVTMTWQRIFALSLQVTVVGVLPHASVERS